MADSSFDIVSKVDRQEADNALQQAAKELATRFDFKGTDTVIEWKGELIVEITSSTEDRALGRRLEAFVRSMSQPDSQRLSMAREIREAHERQRLALKAGEGRDRSDGPEKETPGPTKDRGR